MSSRKGAPVTVGSVIACGTDRLSELFREHHRRVFLAAYRITGNQADAEDVMQAVFLRLANGDGELNNPGSYLHRAAINGALDLLRKRKAGPMDPLEQAAEVAATSRGSFPEAETSGRQLGTLLRTAIAELPTRAAEMFVMRYVEELDNREIATVWRTSAAVVAVTLHNARGKLKKRLSELERGLR